MALLALVVAVAPPGFRTHMVTNTGMSVVLPIGWQTLAQRDAAFPGVREILTRLNACSRCRCSSSRRRTRR